MKTSTFLLTVTLGLVLAGSTWAGPQPDESTTAEPETKATEPVETDTQAMNKGDLVQELATSPIDEESPDSHELTHITQQGVSPKDNTSGLPTGKRQHKPVSITKGVDKASPVSSVSDPASGLPTGKRQHKPFTVRSEIDKSTPVSADGVTDSSLEASDNGLVHQDSWVEARMGDEPKETLSFEDAVEVCRDENDLQACVDHKTGQSHVKELDKSSTK